MRWLSLIVVVVFAAGCASTHYSTYAERTGLPREQIREVVQAAKREFRMVVIDVRKANAGDLQVLLAERKDAGAGSIVIYRKSAAGWRAVEDPAGGYRAWAIP